MARITEHLHGFAKYYADHGWPVLPLHWPKGDGCSCHNPECDNIGKHPRTRNGAYDATTGPDQINEWWQQWPEANLGLNVGRSRLVVIDIDPKHNGCLRDLPLSAAGRHTITVRTGGGGWHLYYEAPQGLDISNSNKRCPPGIDIRAGEGAYVVAPPSLHASGQRYRYLPGLAPWNLGPAPLPASLLPILTIRNDPAREDALNQPVTDPPPALDARHPYVASAFNGELAHLAEAQCGYRNSALNRAAFNLGQFVGAGLLSRAEVEGVLEQAALAIGLGAVETRNTIRSGLDAGLKTPRHHWPDFEDR